MATEQQSAEPLVEPLQVPAASTTAFPLSVSSNRRYLVDAAGRPFLINGDAAWSLIADLKREEVDLYLADRKVRGFNTLLINLLEHKFARRAPANAYADAPFSVAGDFATPNEAYFRHVDWLLERARAEGFLVLLAPSYVGYRGSDEGWYKEMATSGSAKLRAYGSFLGKRYAHLKNVVWVHAGDDNPPDKELSRAVAMGIKEAGMSALHTAHTAPEASAADVWGADEWLALSTVYTYGSVCPAALGEYLRPRRRPFFLIEGAYENEHGAKAQRIRSQAYHALLCGAAGQVFGNNPVWHFGSSGLFPAPADWRNSLGSRGAQSMSHLARLFVALPWWRLVPDTDKALLKSADAQRDGAVGAATSDGDLAMLYLPDLVPVTADLSRFNGRAVAVSWFDPSNGKFVASERLAAGGTVSLLPHGANAAGDSDWVVVLKSTAPGAPAASR